MVVGEPYEAAIYNAPCSPRLLQWLCIKRDIQRVICINVFRSFLQMCYVTPNKIGLCHMRYIHITALQLKEMSNWIVYTVYG